MLTLLACDMSNEGVSSEKPEISNALPQTEITVETKVTSKAPVEKIPASLPASAFKTVEWTDLMPQEDLDILLNPPSYVTDVEDGSFEDQINNQIQNAPDVASDDPYQQALTSTRIIPEMDGQAIRIPGFIVPLEYNDEQIITQFLLVPFFGACIHVPPPPPNQVIFVNYPQGFKLDALYDPFWVSGILKTSVIKNEMATAAYTMQMQHSEIYTEK